MVVHERAALPSVALPPGSSVSRHKCLGGIEYGPEREQLYGVLSAPLLGGIAERWTADGYEAARVVFGPEPSDAQIYQWLGVEWHKLRFSPAAPGERARVRLENPKRVRREARKTLESSGAGTRAQQALAREREQAGERLRRERRQRRLQSEEERFRLRQQKKREKKRGR